MASQVTNDRLVELLRALADLLHAVGETRPASAIEALTRSAEASCGDDVRRQEVIREILLLFGGMGSFQDLVLQNAHGVLSQQDDLDRLRQQLFEEARRELK